MKISVELSDSELKDVCKFTGIKKKGPAIRKMVLDELMMRKRRAFVDEVLAGKFSAEFAGFEEARALDRKKSRERARLMSE